MRRFHFASPETSARVRRVRDLLAARAARGATSREIMLDADVVAPSTVIAELRACGYEIETTRERTSISGAAVWRYRLVAVPVEARTSFCAALRSYAASVAEPLAEALDAMLSSPTYGDTPSEEAVEVARRALSAYREAMGEGR